MFKRGRWEWVREKCLIEKPRTFAWYTGDEGLFTCFSTNFPEGCAMAYRDDLTYLCSVFETYVRLLNVLKGFRLVWRTSFRTPQWLSFITADENRYDDEMQNWKLLETVDALCLSCDGSFHRLTFTMETALVSLDSLNLSRSHGRIIYHQRRNPIQILSFAGFYFHCLPFSSSSSGLLFFASPCLAKSTFVWNEKPFSWIPDGILFISSFTASTTSLCKGLKVNLFHARAFKPNCFDWYTFEFCFLRCLRRGCARFAAVF